MIPVIWCARDNLIYVTVPDIVQAIGQSYNQIRIFTDTSTTGDFTTVDGTITLVSGQTGYIYYDSDAASTTYYKAALYKSTATVATGTKSDYRLYDTCAAYIMAHDVRRELASGDSDTEAIGAEHEHDLWQMCAAISRAVDRHKRVEAGAYEATTSAIRYFSSRGGVTQDIDPAVSVSAVAVEETDGTYTTWTAETDYFTWPYAASSIGEPIRRIEVNLKSDSTKSSFTAGQKRTKVTGVWGITATPPEEVQRACRIMAARWYKRAQQGWQDTGANPEFGALNYTKSIDPEAERILAGVFPHTGAGI